jgi:pilus assembly protein Flp/PilA
VAAALNGNRVPRTRLAKPNRQPTAIEYGLIASLIAVAAITAMTSVGTELIGTFTKVSNNMKRPDHLWLAGFLSISLGRRQPPFFFESQPAA